MQVSSELIEAAKKEKIRYISEHSKGYTRKKYGQTFHYFDENDKRITKREVVERINKLVIPPAWKEVWISPQANTHLQVTGIDEKGRKQYIYHPEWVRICQENKFSKLVDFGLVLPKIRSRVRKDLDIQGLDQKKILATVVWLLENTFIRVGNEEYAKENNSFGLTTLRNKHVDVKGSTVHFEFKGKSGVEHVVHISNPKVAKTIKECIELPGFELFQYIDEKGDRHVVDSGDVNSYLADTTGEDVSAKDFRTWGGTVLSAVTLHDLGEFTTETEAEKKVKQTVKTVCSHLRNTPSVCRNYYIHPTVLKTYKQKQLIPHFRYAVTDSTSGLLKDEYRVLTLLQKY